MEEVVGSNPRGGRNFSHGKLSKINPLVLKSHYMIKRQIQKSFLAQISLYTNLHYYNII